MQPMIHPQSGHTKITKEAKHTKSEHDPSHALFEQDHIEIRPLEAAAPVP